MYRSLKLCSKTEFQGNITFLLWIFLSFIEMLTNQLPALQINVLLLYFPLNYTSFSVSFILFGIWLCTMTCKDTDQMHMTRELTCLLYCSMRQQWWYSWQTAGDHCFLLQQQLPHMQPPFAGLKWHCAGHDHAPLLDWLDKNWQHCNHTTLTISLCGSRSTGICMNTFLLLVYSR
jgi:hypothetical protein